MRLNPIKHIVSQITNVKSKPDYRKGKGDRRQQPTPLISRYLFKGSRQNNRRLSDPQSGYYVDRFERQDIFLIILTLFFCVLDAIFTLYHIHKGAMEINPIAAYYLNLGTTPFLIYKILPTILGLFILLIHKNFRRVKQAVALICLIYFLLFSYHLILFFVASKNYTRFL